VRTEAYTAAGRHHGLWARGGFNPNRKEKIGLDETKEI
jgi:hypothetical protein